MIAGTVAAIAARGPALRLPGGACDGRKCFKAEAKTELSLDL